MQNDWSNLLPAVAMAINHRDASARGPSPFFFTHGYHADPISLDEAGTLREALFPLEKAGETFVKRFRDTTQWAQTAIAMAQERQQEQANRSSLTAKNLKSNKALPSIFV